MEVNKFRGAIVFVLISFLIFLPLQIKAEESIGDLLIINKENNKLAFFQNGEKVRVFDVATGRTMELTPEGKFKIVNKIKNRPYYTDNIPGGSPENPLGDRWLGLNARGTWGTTYAIHGNNNKNSIGKYVSAGCIRMYNDEIHWLFEKVRVGTPVLITTSKANFSHLAAKTGYEVTLPASTVIDKELMIVKETKLYRKANTFFDQNVTLSPQVVNANAETEAGDWYRVSTWLGNLWIQGKDVIEGKLKGENHQLVIKERKPIYASPIAEKQLGVISPQKVESFEHINNWHHIKSWKGDVWIKVEEK